MAPVRPLPFGLEEELGLVVLGPDRQRLEPGAAARRLLRRLEDRAPGLPGIAGGRFLANGSLVYVDYGAHPEIATAECRSPDDLVAVLGACEDLLGEAARALVVERDVAEVRLLRSNVDPLDPRVSYGCHESYCVTAPPRAHAPVLLGHLASRVAFTGAGGLDSRSPGVRFCPSPRLRHFTEVSSGSTTRARGLFNERDEPLAGHGYRRLHVIAGDSASGEWTTWLKVGTTALVAALVDAGLAPREEVALRDPLAAARRFAADADGGARALLAGERERPRATDLQRRYLRAVRRHLGHPRLPDWAEAVCEAWGRVLDALDDDRDALAGRLEWPTRHLLGTACLERRGLDWERARRWTAALEAVHARARRREALRDLEPRERLDALWRGGGAGRCAVEGLAAAGDVWHWRDAVERWDAARAALFRLDLAWGDLAGGGLRAGLEARGALADRVVGARARQRARGCPPAGTRAALRGRWVRRLAGEPDHVCAWDRVLGPDACLDLSDPLAAEERWVRIGGERGVR